MGRGRKNAGAVAAGHEVTANAAAEILADGGNAFDAVIAGLWAACFCEPVLASPGGGGFLMGHHDGRTRLVDFFVDTPRRKRASADIDFREIIADFGTATQAFHIGAGATATPGFVPGLFEIHRLLGSLPMTRLVEPAIRAAREGVALNGYQGWLFGIIPGIMLASAEATALYGRDGRTLGVGETFRNPGLADALDALAREGPRLEREGEIGRGILALQGEGGHLTADDFKSYRVELREPIAIPIGRSRAAFNPPPSLGGALIAAMLGELDDAAAGSDGPAARSVALAADRVDRLWRREPEAIAKRLELMIDPARPKAVRGTTQVSVVDAAGNAASATVTNGEGNGTVVPGCGYMLNNMLGEEDLHPNGFHAWTPGIRLASMMAPTIAFGDDGGLVVLGSGGSNRIRTAIFQVLVNRLIRHRPLEAAIEAPRFHVERGHLDFENPHDEGIRAALKRAFADHREWAEPNMFFGGVHGVELSASGTVSGHGDPRRSGAFVAV